MQFLRPFHPLGAAFQRALDTEIETLQYEKGELIVAKGKTVTSYGYFKSGYALAHATTGKLIIQRFYVPGHVAMPGDEPLGSSASDSSVVALCTCVLYTLELAKLKALCKRYEEAQFLLTAFQGREIEFLRRRADCLAHADAQTRLDLFRLEYPQELIDLLPNRGTLANYLGMDASHLSRLQWPPLDELRAKYACK